MLMMFSTSSCGRPAIPEDDSIERRDLSKARQGVTRGQNRRVKAHIGGRNFKTETRKRQRGETRKRLKAGELRVIEKSIRCFFGAYIQAASIRLKWRQGERRSATSTVTADNWPLLTHGCHTAIPAATPTPIAYLSHVLYLEGNTTQTSNAPSHHPLRV
jgi:hypothetical protein